MTSRLTPCHRLARAGLIALPALLSAAAAHAQSSRVVLTPAPGFSLVWDGNNGGFGSAAAGTGPSNNVALASNGTVAFTSSDLGPELGIPFHVKANLNDGLYGNINSWISASGDPMPYAALQFAASVNVRSIAWGRDNGLLPGDSCGGTCTDRTLGVYTLQFTQVTAPDASTAETGDAATGWADLGTVEYRPGPEDANFTSYLRHRFDVSEGGSPIAATGIRIKVPAAGLAGGTDIDEIEVNPLPDPVPPVSNFIEVAPAAGFGIAWDRNEGVYSTTDSPAPAPVNDASVSRGAVAFGSSELGPALGIPFHRYINLNDGLYGNSHSWIPNFVAGDSAPFAGINLGGRRSISSIAWSRDNGDEAGDCCGGTLTDRALGTYVIQITTAPNPGPNTQEACGPTPDSGWITVGTINFKANHPTFFNSHLRHRFDLTQGGAPITATGIRIKVPNANSAIDEIEVNGNIALEKGAIRIAAAAGIELKWDGNDGQYGSPAAGAAPPANRALASQGTTPFTSSDLGPLLNIPFHRAVNLNDGLYGNANSWISANGIGGNSDTGPFAGLNFNGTVNLSSIAWGRDNGNAVEGTFGDRALDTYSLQYTLAPSPDATTPETGDAATGWQDLGTVTYGSAAPPAFNPPLRHRFDLSSGGAPIEATGIRIKVASGNTAIDEIEINSPAGAPPPPSPVGIAPAAGYAITWDGNDGQFKNDAAGARPPANRALASLGSTAFTSSDLGPVLGIPFHVAANLNDGLYGNAHSWISANGIGGSSDPDPAAGIVFNGTVGIRNIAWSRDNGDAPEGNFTDRALGTYTLQFTTAASPGAATAETGDPATGWANLGTVEYRRAELGVFTPFLRHRFDVSAGGQPVAATAIRIKVSNGQMDIDEIEVNSTTNPSACCNAEPSFTLAAESAASDEDAGAVNVAGFLTNVSAGPGETAQTVSVRVSNDNPSLFAVQPAFDAAGALTYTAAPGASGSANVTVTVTDDGGTGVCGDDTAVKSFVINVRAVNDCPTLAAVEPITVAAGTTANGQLVGADADGEAVTYLLVGAAGHGAVVVTAATGAFSYAPSSGYAGPDSFTAAAVDAAGCRSDVVTVRITVTGGTTNRCPTALADVGPGVELFLCGAETVIIAGDYTNSVARCEDGLAKVTLDGRDSTDPDGNTLAYSWFVGQDGVFIPLAIGALSEVSLEPGMYTIRLVVDDGRCTDTMDVDIHIITPAEAIDALISDVQAAGLGSRNRRPLISLLKSSAACFDRCLCASGVRQLEAFIRKVRAQVSAEKPVLAEQLMGKAQEILDHVDCGQP